MRAGGAANARACVPRCVPQVGGGNTPKTGNLSEMTGCGDAGTRRRVDPTPFRSCGSGGRVRSSERPRDCCTRGMYFAERRGVAGSDASPKKTPPGGILTLGGKRTRQGCALRRAHGNPRVESRIRVPILCQSGLSCANLSRPASRPGNEKTPRYAGFSLAGAAGLEPATPGFGDRCATNCATPLGCWPRSVSGRPPSLEQ